jgi:hypothetical protein
MAITIFIVQRVAVFTVTVMLADFSVCLTLCFSQNMTVLPSDVPLCSLGMAKNFLKEILPL